MVEWKMLICGCGEKFGNPEGINAHRTAYVNEAVNLYLSRVTDRYRTMELLSHHLPMTEADAILDKLGRT
ncbi:MAG: hypothetical protein HZB84_08960 [Deltaproteobacteria bacterium]|nr:hypothetical protein [Deltaproteobacteria bacterium]